MIGLSCLDHSWQIESFPPIYSRTKATQYQSQGGGPAANAAVSASILGAKVSLWAIHGDDHNGKLAQEELEHFGVDCSNIKSVASAKTTVSGILIQENGERQIFPYKDETLKLAIHDNAEHLDLNKVKTFDCVMTDSRHPNMNETVLKKARAEQIPVVADFGNLDNWHLASYADYLIASEECATQLLGKKDPEQALELLRQTKEQFVGITLGEEGFLYSVQDELKHIPAFSVDVMDTTGAGDVFHGAFAFGIAKAWDVHYCALFANVTAALSCKALGGRAGIASPQDIKEMLLNLVL